MNFLDVILLLLVVASAVHGLRLGAAIQVFSFGGFWVGLLLGALIAPALTGLVSTPTWKAFLSIAIVFGVAGVLGVLGRHVGVQSWRLIRKARLGLADAGLGALVAIGATLLASWLAASILVNAPAQVLSRQIEGSAIIRGLDNVLPPAPSVFSRIQGLVNTEGFPQVFAQLAPTPAGPVTMPSSAQLQSAVNAAGGSTVKIEGVGCGEIQEGSGFVVAPGIVVTNAHVVAGVSQPVVLDNAGRHSAVPILFDPSFDLAVLRVDGLQDPSLRLDDSDVGRGTQAAVLGYPEGGPFQAVPAGVLQLFQAEGRDIYGQGLTVRSVYELQATVRPGNSGGPLVEPDGEVVGVVFSRSSSDSSIGYALASPGVVSRVDQAESSPSPTGTGGCIS